MMELEELRNALNWEGVFQGRDCLIVKFDLAQAGLVNGLRNNDQTFYLDFPEFMEHPVAFMVTNGPETFQYWVLGDRLHRNAGPAKVSMNTETKTSHQTWFSNGLRHNPHGPAEIIYKGHSYTDVHPRTQDPVGEDYIVEEFDEMECYWFEGGIPPQYPKPFTMYCQNGHRIYRLTDAVPVLSDFRGEPCFEADKLVGNWAREGDLLTDDPFRLRYVVARDYTRRYSNGEAKAQDCAELSALNWIIQGELQDTTEDKRSHVKRDLFPLWNIWEGPLFADEQEAVFAMGIINA